MNSVTLRRYNYVHKWAERKMTKLGVCFYCQEACKTQWANIDHKYRMYKSEWQEVCYRCHHEFDVLMNNKRMGRPRKPLSQHSNLSKSYQRLITYAWYNPSHDQ